MKLPSQEIMKNYCALIFSMIDILCNRFAGSRTAKREVNKTMAMISIRGMTCYNKVVTGVANKIY